MTIESVKVTEILTKYPKWRNFQLIGTKRKGTWKVVGAQVQFKWSDADHLHKWACDALL
jgi:hypothetical protein